MRQHFFVYSPFLRLHHKWGVQNALNIKSHISDCIEREIFKRPLDFLSAWYFTTHTQPSHTCDLPVSSKTNASNDVTHEKTAFWSFFGCSFPMQCSLATEGNGQRHPMHKLRNGKKNFRVKHTLRCINWTNLEISVSFGREMQRLAKCKRDN